MFDRAPIIDKAFTDRVRAGDLPEPLASVTPAEIGLTPSRARHLFEVQVMSRHLDLFARRSKGKTFYSIGSAGHEGMVALAEASRNSDMAFLHYRDAAFLLGRKMDLPGATPLYDMMLSFTASADDPVSGGRHKVLGGKEIFVPPQTSTIASHLPKAVGAAHSISINKKLANPDAVLPGDAIILCSFGDASANHSTAQGAINAAAWTAYQHLPMPLLFICEDNDIGISVRTPKGWIEQNFSNRPGLRYLKADGRDLADGVRGCRQAVDYVRRTRRPAFLHFKTERLMGHAGADIEAAYTEVQHIEAVERHDPLLHTARLLRDHQIASSDDICTVYEDMRRRVEAVAEAAIARPKLTMPTQVMASLEPPSSGNAPPALPTENVRKNLMGKELKQAEQPVPMARHINLALADLMLRYQNIIAFGEDVGRKGGVYSVTTGLQKKFGPARVIDTLLDEQSILGLAIGVAHNGLIPIPEIQFLAYLHNAEDQIRGEAATLPFFSNGQYANPMVVRIAGLGYQKGFGGHFHNDNSLSVLRDIPGLVVGCPSTGPDAAAMMGEAVRLAHEENRVVIMIEPIALYATSDLHDKDDGLWAAPYQGITGDGGPGSVTRHGTGEDLLIITYGNGHYLSRQAQKALAEKHDTNVSVVDMRWLQPLPHDALLEMAQSFDTVLIVDECRQTGSVSEQIVTGFVEAGLDAKIGRVAADDSFIPLGPAATATLPSRDGIVAAALSLVGGAS